MTSIIRYKYKADREFESVQFEGMSCSLGELKRLIVEKSSKSGTRHPPDDYELIITNPATHEEYKNNSEMIPRNTSVVVARRIRGISETLTSSSNKKSDFSFVGVIHDFLQPAMQQRAKIVIDIDNTSLSNSTAIDKKLTSAELSTQPLNVECVEEKSEEQLIHGRVKNSRAQDLNTQRSKQTGHMLHQWPLLLPTNVVTTTDISISSDSLPENDSTPLIPSPNRSCSISSRNIMNLNMHDLQQNSAHYQHHHSSNHPHKRGFGNPRSNLYPRNTGQSNGPLVSPHTGEGLVEQNERRPDALGPCLTHQFQKMNNGSLALVAVAGAPNQLDTDGLPKELLCTICKNIYKDAVMTPCCDINFCDECIRNALIHSEDHQCPKCQRQNVPIDQIKPNLFLRNQVNRWYAEVQNKDLQSYVSATNSLVSSIPNNSLLKQILDQNTVGLPNGKMNKANQLPSIDDTNNEGATFLLKNQKKLDQISAEPVRIAPIVIKMQSTANIQSAQHSDGVKKGDGKVLDTDETIISDRKGVITELSAVGNKHDTEDTLTIDDLIPPLTTIESKIDIGTHHTSPSQVAPESANLSPLLDMKSLNVSYQSTVPNYYANMEQFDSSTHHGMPYPRHTVTGLSKDVYTMPMQRIYYQSPAPMPFHGVHHQLGVPILLGSVPPGVMHSYPNNLPYTHPSIGLAMSTDTTSGFPLDIYDASISATYHCPGANYSSISTSTLTSHQQSTSLAFPNSISLPLSENEFYMRQKCLQQIRQSSTSKRSRSRSHSFYSSNSSTSSYSHRNSQSRRREHRSSRSRSRKRTSENRQLKSPMHDHHRIKRSQSSEKQIKFIRSPEKYRRSPTDRHQRLVTHKDSRHSSRQHRNSSPPSRPQPDRERKRSARPPPTVQQSIQRTMVYMRESSLSATPQKKSSINDRDRSRSPNQSKSERKKNQIHVSSLSSKTTTDRQCVSLASKIEPVYHENSSVLSSNHLSRRYRRSPSISVHRPSGSQTCRQSNNGNQSKNEQCDQSNSSSPTRKKFRRDEEKIIL